MFAPILAAAERQLSKTLGRNVCLGDVARLSEDGRPNLLLRSRDLSTPAFQDARSGKSHAPTLDDGGGLEDCRLLSEVGLGEG